MNNNEQQQKLNLLPEFCYGVLDTTNEIIIIKQGELGYWKTNWPAAKTKAEADSRADELNSQLDITKKQKYAMERGSMFGWDDLTCEDTKEEALVEYRYSKQGFTFGELTCFDESRKSYPGSFPIVQMSKILKELEEA